VELYACSKEVLATADLANDGIIRRIDCTKSGLCSGTIYLYLVLVDDSDIGGIRLLS